MTTPATETGSKTWLVWVLVSAGLLLFAGVNAHLFYVAVQSQPAATLTVKLRVAPVALTLADVGAIVGAQLAPACVTVNV